MRVTLFLSLLLGLAACAPSPTVKQDDALTLSCTPKACTLVAPKAIDYGMISLAGPDLRLSATPCGGECPRSVYGFAEVVLQERAAPYPQRLTFKVLTGNVTIGRALVTLIGDDSSSEAVLGP